MERLGYTVSGYADASSALNDFRADPHRFDAVVTDLALRGMSGLDLAAELHRLRPDVPTVLMSGYFGAEATERAQRLGVTELLLKPNTIEEFAETLYRVLHPAGVRDRGGLVGIQFRA